MQDSMIMQSALDEEGRDEGGGGARELMDGSEHDYTNFLDDDEDEEGDDSPQNRRKSFRYDEENSTAMDKEVTTSKKKKDRKPAPKAIRDEEKLLHSGRLLGDLPSLENRSSPGGAAGMYVDRDMSQALEFPERSSPSGLMGGGSREPSRKADDKVKKKKKSKGDPVPPDMPKEFLCQLSQRPMSDPVKTIYNNIFDRTVISNWFSQQGRVCPLTGAPLAETDLKPLPELGDKIRAWILAKSSTKIGQGEAPSSGSAAIITPEKEKSTTSAAAAASKAAEDDLYDF